MFNFGPSTGMLGKAMGGLNAAGSAFGGPVWGNASKVAGGVMGGIRNRGSDTVYGSGIPDDAPPMGAPPPEAPGLVRPPGIMNMGRPQFGSTMNPGGNMRQGQPFQPNMGITDPSMGSFNFNPSGGGGGLWNMYNQIAGNQGMGGMRGEGMPSMRGSGAPTSRGMFY